MDCLSCGHPNREGARFCAECGTSLSKPVTCSGSAATAATGPARLHPSHRARKIAASRSALDGERKQVTVLFADVMGSMELAEKTEPES